MVLKKWAVYLRDPLLEPKLQLCGTFLNEFFRALREELPRLKFQVHAMALATPAYALMRWPKLPHAAMHYAFVLLWLSLTWALAMLPIYALHRTSQTVPRAEFGLHDRHA